MQPLPWRSFESLVCAGHRAGTGGHDRGSRNVGRHARRSRSGDVDEASLASPSPTRIARTHDLTWPLGLAMSAALRSPWSTTSREASAFALTALEFTSAHTFRLEQVDLLEVLTVLASQTRGSPRGRPPPRLRRGLATTSTTGCGSLPSHRKSKLPSSGHGGARRRSVRPGARGGAAPQPGRGHRVRLALAGANGPARQPDGRVSRPRSALSSTKCASGSRTLRLPSAC